MTGLEEDSKTDKEELKSESETDTDDEERDKVFNDACQPEETPYIENKNEELGQVRQLVLKN